RIDKFNLDVAADALKVAVPPVLEGIGRGFAAAFFHRTLIAATRRMRIDLIRRAVLDINHSAVGFPAGNTGSIMVVRVSDTAVDFLFVLVFFRVGCRIAALPEVLNELFAFFVGLQMLESLALLIGDDVGNVFVQPFLPWALKLLPELLLSPLLFLLGKRLRYCGVRVARTGLPQDQRNDQCRRRDA